MKGTNGAPLIRVMLVEDNIDYRRLLERLLARQPDLEVAAQAGSLTEARELADIVSFDVAVLDLRLPDGDGTDLISDLRRGSPGVAVLILSASLDPVSLDKASRLSVDDVMDKLSSLPEVLGTIRRLGT
jgi:DNA-binding NarL/FixJ family response regulator